MSEVSQLDRKEGYIDFESPFIHPEAGTLPKLLLSPVQRQDLVSRKAALRAEKTLRIDTLTTFITRRKDLLLESVDHRRYHLDDYNRFPSVREVLVEIIPELSLRRVNDVWQLQLVVSDAVQSRFDRTGSILVMMDGVVLSDLDLLLGFDAMLLEDVDLYLQSFVCGKVVYHGLVNFITKKNYVTALHFPSNVRVVDFQGVAYPVAYNGAVPEGEGQDLRQLLYWHPVLNLDAGSDYRIEIHTPGYAGRFKAVAEGIGVDAVKTGMLPTVEIIKLAGELLAAAKIPKVVIDPVMVCKGAGQPLFPENTKAMIDYLLPLADVVTPNTFEAEQLAGMEEFKSEDDLLEAARKIHGLGAKNVVIKAARIFDNKTVDLLYDGTNATWLRGEKVGTSWTHGAGCSFSACITAELAKGKSVADAVAMAREFVRCGLEHSFPLNQFVGPIYHKALSKYNPVVAGK